MTKSDHMAIFDHHKNYLHHSHVGYPLKEHQKCSTEQKTRVQNVDPIKSYSQKTIFGKFPLLIYYVKMPAFCESRCHIARNLIPMNSESMYQMEKVIIEFR